MVEEDIYNGSMATNNTKRLTMLAFLAAVITYLSLYREYEFTKPPTAGPGSVEKKVVKATTEKRKEMCGIVFLHLRKTGGTHIGNVLRSWLREKTNCCGFTSSTPNTPCPEGPKFMLSKNYDNWKCPHFHFAEQEYNPFNPEVLNLPCIFSVTSIRDPIQRIISHFLYEHVTPHEIAFNTRNPNASSEEMCQSFLNNKSLWASYLNQGNSYPDHFWSKNSLPNYFSYALDPWYGDVKAIDYDLNTNATKESLLIGQQSNQMWGVLGIRKNSEFHHNRCNRSLAVGVDRALQTLSKFSLVLMDNHKEIWWNELAKGLSSLGQETNNMTLLGNTKGRSNTKTCGPKSSGGGYKDVPTEILEKIKWENELDIAIYNAWLKKTQTT